MFPRILLLFTIVPLAELALLMYLADQTSWKVAVGLVLATGVAGAVLLKFQGLLVWRRMREQLRRGEPPTDAILDGLMILVAACLLITPGIITDVFGVLLLLPPVRLLVRRRVRDRVTAGFRQQMSSGGWTMSGAWSSEASDHRDAADRTDKIIHARIVKDVNAQLEDGKRNSTDSAGTSDR